MSMQPNSGAQGEYAGLLTIAAFHRANGHHERRVCLIPTSAHGTNPASAQMAGMEVVIVKAAEKKRRYRGRRLPRQGPDAGAGDPAPRPCMINLSLDPPGSFEETVREVLRDHPTTHGGARSISTGRNLNALCRPRESPARFGGGRSPHLNLHKTFCIPPMAAAAPGMGTHRRGRPHLARYLPGHPEGRAAREGPVSGGRPTGRPRFLPISWAYLPDDGRRGG